MKVDQHRDRARAAGDDIQLAPVRRRLLEHGRDINVAADLRRRVQYAQAPGIEAAAGDGHA